MGTSQQLPDLPAALAACPWAAAVLVPLHFSLLAGARFLGLPQDLRLPERSPLPFPTRLRDSQAPEPGPDREEAGRPPKSAPSYKWEAVAVTQVSRGPSARRERARAAPLSAVAIMKKEKPRAAPQAAFAAARRAQLSASRPRGLQSVQTPHPAVSADPGRMGWVPSRWLPFFFFFATLANLSADGPHHP